MSFRNRIKHWAERTQTWLPPKRLALLLLGTAILSFGMHNIHRRVGITEGGVLGMVLLLDHQLSLPPWLMTPVLDITCYLLGLRFLGWDFIKLSAVSSLGMSAFFRLWEQFPPVLPDLSAHPLSAALLGGAFVGVGVGLVVRQGGSSGGDDALALVISKLSRCRLSRAYLVTDLSVLLLSLSYIPFRRIVYSLVTVTVSSLLIDWIQSLGSEKGQEEAVGDAG
ncbi:MAG: YitT family protein [Oscillospiraceae bacterium]